MREDRGVLDPDGSVLVVKLSLGEVLADVAYKISSVMRHTSTGDKTKGKVPQMMPQRGLTSCP